MLLMQIFQSNRAVPCPSHTKAFLFSFLFFLIRSCHSILTSTEAFPMTKFMPNVGALSLDKLEQAGTVSRAHPPVAILAGGLGTRLSEETALKPKPLVEIGGKPVIWHVMKHYDAYSMNSFSIALGYKKEAVIRYFLDLHALNRDLTVRTRDGSVSFHDGNTDLDWTIHLVDTGPDTSTGGRIKPRLRSLRSRTFMPPCATALSNVNLAELLAFHRSHGKPAT